MIESIAEIGKAVLSERDLIDELKKLSKKPAIVVQKNRRGKSKLHIEPSIVDKLDPIEIWRYILAKSQTVLSTTEVGTEILVIEVDTKRNTAHWPQNNIWTVNTIDDEILEKILHTDLRSNRSDPVVPTKKISKENGKVTPAKIKAALNSLAKALNNLKNTPNILTANLQPIYNNLWNYIKQNPKKNYILSVKIDNKWPQEIPEFRYAIIEDFLSRATTHNGIVSINEKGTCMICGQRNVPVYGFALSGAGIKFSTYDFSAFVPENKKEYAIRTTPVCLSCYVYLRVGWLQILHKESDYKIGELNYVVVPSIGTSKENVIDFVENIGSPKSKFAVFSELAEAEETIEDFETNIDLLVYRKEQAKMEVYLMEQNIPPGVFRKIRTKNYQVAKILGWKQNNKAPLAILLAYIEILNAVYSDERSKTKKLKELAQIIHALIREQKWPGTKYAYFTKYIEKKAHNEQKGLDFAHIAPLFVYLYFTGGDKLPESIVESIDFPSRTAEFAFWTGVLARHVVEMQKEAGSQPGAEPFRKRIRKVRMNVHQLQRLFTEAFEKAKTYSEILGETEKRRWITWTNSIIEKCASKATNLDAATPDEIGFFFTLGYGLYWKIVKPEGKKEGEENGE